MGLVTCMLREYEYPATRFRTGEMHSFCSVTILAAMILRGMALTVHNPPASRRFGDEDGLEVNVITNGSYQIIMSGKVWLNSGPVAVRNNGNWQSSEPELRTLVLRNTTWSNGEDTWGSFMNFEFWWSSPSGAFNFLTDINAYLDLPVITFSQVSIFFPRDTVACFCSLLTRLRWFEAQNLQVHVVGVRKEKVGMCSPGIDEL